MMQNNDSFCENCGQIIIKNDKFCENCGLDLILDVKNNINTQRKFTFPFIYIILIATLINGYLLIDKNNELNDTLKYNKQTNTKLEKKLR